MDNPNPFSSQLRIEMYEKYIRTAPGNIAVYLVERDQPISVHMTDDLLKLLGTLSTGAKDMVHYIMRYLGKSTDTIEIKPEIYMARMGINSIKTFNRVKFELIETLILPKKNRKNTYWINPKYFYKGKRHIAYPESIVIPSENTTVLKLREMGILDERRVGNIDIINQSMDKDNDGENIIL